jgi:hypothetical protein
MPIFNYNNPFLINKIYLCLLIKINYLIQKVEYSKYMD